MTDKIKETAEKLWRGHNCLVNIENFGNYSLERVITKENFMKAITEYESSEIARLRGIIERAKIAKKNLEVEWEYRTKEQYNLLSERSIEVRTMIAMLNTILSEAEEQ